MKTSQNLYWSKKVYLKRIEDWKLDIKHARYVAKISTLEYDRNIVNSLVEGLRMHKIFYKVKKLAEEREDNLF